MLYMAHLCPRYSPSLASKTPKTTQQREDEGVVLWLPPSHSAVLTCQSHAMPTQSPQSMHQIRSPACPQRHDTSYLQNRRGCRPPYLPKKNFTPIHTTFSRASLQLTGAGLKLGWLQGAIKLGISQARGPP